MLNYTALLNAASRNTRYLVLGDPVSHSRSPGLQNAAFEKADLGRPYARFHIKVEDLPEFSGFAREHLKGFNLTVPHKHAILPLCDEVAPAAALCGSVNTVAVRDGRLYGYSTDGPGLEYALKREFGFTPQGRTILFLGAGGACRATAFHLALNGASAITIANRTPEKAAELAGAISENSNCKACGISIADEEDMRYSLANADVVIQATSCGLKDDDPAPFDVNWIAPECRFALFDTIYKDTALQRACRARGLRTAGGKFMLIGQGAASFRIWTGIEPDIAVMEKGFDEDISQEDTVC
jgi:shikimate dehydrogenase